MPGVGITSKITKATTTSNSLRATIPEEVVKDMDLRIGDTLGWEVIEEKGRKIAKVKRLE